MESQIWKYLPFLTILLSLSVLALGLGSAPAQGRVAQVSATQVDLPEDTEPKALKNLSRGVKGNEGARDSDTSIAEIDSIRIQELPGADEDPLKLVWVLTAGNTRPVTQRALVSVRLVDGEGNELESGRAFVVLGRGTKDKEFQVKMKAAAQSWQSAEKVKIIVEWQL